MNNPGPMRREGRRLMDSVYIVTSGSYSDYQIVIVFATKELADAFVSDNGDCDVEEYPLNTVVPKVYKWFAWIKLDSGEIYHVSEFLPVFEQELRDSGNGNLSAGGATKDEAIKNVSDYRRAYLARPSQANVEAEA